MLMKLSLLLSISTIIFGAVLAIYADRLERAYAPGRAPHDNPLPTVAFGLLVSMVCAAAHFLTLAFPGVQ